MKNTLTYIHFRVWWHILGSDTPKQCFGRDAFQDFMRTLNADPRIGDYDDFSYRPHRCELAKVREAHAQGGEAFSKIVYAKGQLTVVEEWADIAADEFAKKSTSILAAWFKHFPTVAVVESCCLRALVQPSELTDSRRFLGDRVLRLGERLQQTFSKMPHKVGFAVTCQRDFSGGQPMMMDTKVQSWTDNRSVWVEVSGSAPMRTPINAANTASVEQPFKLCRNFLEDEVIGLLEAFDQGSGSGD